MLVVGWHTTRKKLPWQYEWRAAGSTRLLLLVPGLMLLVLLHRQPVAALMPQPPLLLWRAVLPQHGTPLRVHGMWACLCIMAHGPEVGTVIGGSPVVARQAISPL